MGLQHQNPSPLKPGQLKRRLQREALYAARGPIPQRDPQRDETLVYKPLG